MASESLKALMSQAGDQTLVLPDFQRDFVWKPSDVIKLLASLLNNYPIGGLLLMENSGLYSYRRLDGVDLDEPYAEESVEPAARQETVLILDGQQRLTSCYRAFYGTLDQRHRYAGRYYFDYRKFVYNHQRLGEILGPNLEEYLVFEPYKTVERYFRTQADEIASGRFPLDIIFQSPRGGSYSEWLSQYSFNNAGNDKDEYDRLSSIQSSFIGNLLEHVTGYQIHFEKIRRDTKPDVICVVFETINTTGKRLTVFDLLVARCFRYGIKLRDKLEEAVERYAVMRDFDPKGEDLIPIVLPRIIALLDRGSCRRSDMITLDPKRIDELWEKAVSALSRALKLMADEYGCLGTGLIPFADMIPPLAGILSSEGFLGDDLQRERLKKWYWRTVFSQYMVSSTETKIARAYREWTDENGWLRVDGTEPESVREFTLRVSVLDDVFRVDSGIYRGVMTLLIANGARDFGRDTLCLKTCSWDEIEDHHIYPKRFLQANGIRGNRANWIVNRTPIRKKTNIKIGANAPHVYFRDSHVIGSTEVSSDLMEEHAIPIDVVLREFSREGYEDFLEARKVGLLIKIEEAVASGVQPDA